MFGFSFGEIFIIALVALLVLGPERLPKVARTAGLFFGRIQRYMNEIKNDLNSTVNTDEIRQMTAQMKQTVENPIKQAETYVQSEASKLQADLTSGLDNPPTPKSTIEKHE